MVLIDGHVKQVREPISDMTMLQSVAVCCSVVQCVAECCSMLQCVAVCCSVLQCASVCFNVLHCVAVHHEHLYDDLSGP